MCYIGITRPSCTEPFRLIAYARKTSKRLLRGLFYGRCNAALEVKIGNSAAAITVINSLLEETGLTNVTAKKVLGKRDYFEGVKEMRMSPPERLLEQFLSELKINLEQRGFKFDFKLLKRHLHLYRYEDHHRASFLFIHESLCGFWEISPNWAEITRLMPSEHSKWAVLLLHKPSGENRPLGFLISSNDFIKMKSGFGMNRLGRIRIHEKDLSLKNKFNNWERFFRLLNSASVTF